MNEFKKYWTRSKKFEHGRNIFELADGIDISSYYVPLYWKLSLYLEYFVGFKMISWRLLKLLWYCFLLPGSFIPFFLSVVFSLEMLMWAPRAFPDAALRVYMMTLKIIKMRNSLLSWYYLRFLTWKCSFSRCMGLRIFQDL